MKNIGLNLGLASVSLLWGLAAPTRPGARLSGTQGMDLSPAELAQILASADRPGWDEFTVPEFIAGYYGTRAKAATVTILEQTKTGPLQYGDFFILVGALTVAGYEKVGVPVTLMVPYANGARLTGTNPIFASTIRQRAVAALAGRRDPTLRSFWLGLQSDPSRMIRQYVPVGLACSTFQADAGAIESLRTDRDSLVAATAARVKSALDKDGVHARVCRGTARDSVGVHPVSVNATLVERARRYLGRIPKDTIR